MKQLITAILVFIISNNLINAQNNKTNLHNSNEKNNSQLYNYDYISEVKFDDVIVEEDNNGFTNINNTLSKKAETDVVFLDSIIRYKYTDNTLTDSVKYSKQSYIRNEMGRITTQTDYDWQNDDWIPARIDETNYDSNNRRILNKIKTYSEDDNSWNWTRKYEWNYNQNEVIRFVYKWDTEKDGWINYQKYIDSLDSNNKLLFYINNLWNSEKNIWEKWRKNVFIYDDENILIRIDRYKIDKETNDWESNIFSYIDYVYDDNGNLIKKEAYDLYSDDGATLRKNKKIYEYDNNNRRILYEDYKWGRDNTEVVSGTKEEYKFNELGVKSYSLDSELNLETDPNTWEIVGSSIYFYHTQLLSNNEISFSDNYNLFPNPISSDNILTVRIKNNKGFAYKIYTSNGRLILQGSSINKQKEINVSSLEKGVYLLQVSNDNIISNSKFIK